MPVRTECSACGHQFVLDAAKAGRSARCPACDSVVTAGGSGFTRDAPTQSRRPLPEAIPEPPPPPRRRRRESSGGGVAALVLGIIALVLGVPAIAVSWVPFLCIGSLVAAGIGLLLGIMGVAVAMMRKESGLGVSIAGGVVNLLAVLMALVMTAVSGVIVASAEEDTDSTTGQATPAEVRPNPQLAAGQGDWGRRFDPDRDCTFNGQGGALTIQVPPTPHDLSIELGRTNAPRMLREVDGDFSIQVKVCGDIRPMAAGSIPGRLSYQAGGILLWSDERNYVRLERAALNRNGNIITYAAYESRANGLRGPSRSLTIPQNQDISLRLERRGDQLRAFVSSNGGPWRPQQNIDMDLPARVQIGVAAVNAAQQQLQVRFEGLQVEKK